MNMAICDTVWVLSTYRDVRTSCAIVFNITLANISIHIYIYMNSLTFINAFTCSQESGVHTHMFTSGSAAITTSKLPAR